LLYGVEDGAASISSMLPAFRSLLHEAGIDLAAADAGAPSRNGAVVRELLARDAAAGQSLLDALRILPVIEGLTENERQSLLAILANFETPWESELVEVSRLHAEEGIDGFEPLLTGEALADRTPEELSSLAGALMQVSGRESLAFELLDRALIATPDSYSIHYMRAGLSLQGAAADLGSPRSASFVAKAVEHFRVALALRPRSGLTRSGLANALALQAQLLGGRASDFHAAREVMDSATQVDPDNALDWFFRATFMLHTPDGAEGAIAACRKALELDPTLVIAESLLDELTDEHGRAKTDDP
jgi:tetratricopeptide (TPR) repeat protein